ncbi:ATP-binding protein [Arthrobacter sp. ISL-95]|uniref:ATP-binding protein n=1 Tax=Arthrobacter sp. ISL-95 TaxID=2819116 RepID=UPI001BE4E1A4|nr:ATP-binding protein [Arthrobacter sp. ISL-95]MBT2587845.1 ATP-binding protein [Arthrobacter sp. ISL-95]
MKFYGREAELRQLSVSQRRCIVVHGDSGIGKSTLLRHVAMNAAGRQVPINVANLQRAPGAIHHALIAQLASVLEVHVQSRPAIDDTLQLLKAAALRLGAVGGKELARVVAEELLNLLKAKLGPDFGEPIGKVITEILRSEDESLRGKLENASEIGTAEVVLAFAEEVTNITQTDMRLVLDRAERLTDADRSILLDLIELLPQKVQVIVGLSTSKQSDVQFLSDMILSGAEAVAVEALPVQVIQEWLNEAGLTRPSVDILRRVTAGYPFFLEQAISLVSAGQNVEDLSPGAAFQELMRLSWNTLSPLAKTVGRKLALFRDCPPDSFIVKLLDMDQLAWSAVRDELELTHIFIRDAAESSWFHDRRRDMIWKTLMVTSDRAEAASTALNRLSSWLESERDIPSWAIASMPDLLAQPSLLQNLPQSFVKVTELSTAGLAVLLGLLELTERSENPESAFVETATLLTYVSRLAEMESDPVGALEELQTAKFVYTHSEGSQSITTTTLPDVLTYIAILGRMTTDFGRWPVPRLASQLFNQYFSPLLKGFTLANFGLGSPALATVAGETQKAAEHKASLHDTLSMPSLALTADLEGRTFYLGAIFSAEEDRNDAIARLSEAAQALGRANITLNHVLSVPTRRLRSQRFKRLLRLGKVDTLPAESYNALTDIERAGVRLSVTELARGMMNDQERGGSGLERSRGILIDVESSSSYLEVHLIGDSPRAAEINIRQAKLTPFKDPLFMFKLRGAGFVQASEQVESFHESLGSPANRQNRNPVEETVDDITKRLEKFNRLLSPVLISFDEIEDRVRESRQEVIEDLKSLAIAGYCSVEHVSSVENEELRILISPADAPWNGGYHGILLRRPGNGDAITVNVLTQSEAKVFNELEETESPRLEGWRQATYAFADDLVAELLGYKYGDVHILVQHKDN